MAGKKAPTFVTIDGEDYETIEVASGGKTWVLRELSVKENDDIEDASTDEKGKFNGRLNLRMCLATSIVSPATTIDQIGKWPGKRYLALSRAFNQVNSLPPDEAGKDSAPDTSGAQT